MNIGRSKIKFPLISSNAKEVIKKSFAEEISRNNIYSASTSNSIYSYLCSASSVQANKTAFYLGIFKRLMDPQLISTNQLFKWDEQNLTVTFIGESQILFHSSNDAPVQLSLEAFRDLVKQGKIIFISQNSSDLA